jgi:uncharacterized membrane protein YqjE
VIRDVSTSVMNLVQSEVNLLKAEIKESTQNVGRHSAQAAIFGALAMISVLPFLAFLVIGLGRLFGGNYWLSSLIVAAVCAVVGGGLAYLSYRRIKEADLSLPRTRESLERSRSIVATKAEEIKSAAASTQVTDIRTGNRRRVA